MTRSTAFSLFALLPLSGLLVSCSGGSSTPAPGEETIRELGGFSTRIVGTATPPVFSQGFGGSVVGVAGATVSELTQSFAARNLANTRIAFTGLRDGSEDIYTMNIDGTNQTRITNAPGTDIRPSWSPDGTKIAFDTNRDDSQEIYVMNADGSGQTRLTNSPSVDFNASWSPDGSKIAFSSFRDGNYEIYVMNADGTAQTRLTNNAPGVWEYNPTWSPDGSKIAFYSNRDVGGVGEIYVMNADGTAQTRLTNSTSYEGAPSWSPDGAKIAFESQRDGNQEIYVMNANGTSQTRLTNNVATETTPSWSPDGSKVIFASSRDGNYEIYTMNPDGTNPTRLTTTTTTDQDGAWSGYRRPKYIGAGGLLGTECAGFLVGKQGDASASVLVFDTPTIGARASSRVAANTDTETNGPNLAFTISTTTGMSSLKFVNTTQSLKPVIPTLPAGTTGALVLFSSATGLVNDVLPFAANRSASLKPTRVGNNATYAANFTAIFDANGKNLAPGGAKSVTVDEKTGKLVGFE